MTRRSRVNIPVRYRLVEYADGYHADAMEKAGAVGVSKIEATEELYGYQKASGHDLPVIRLINSRGRIASA